MAQLPQSPVYPANKASVEKTPLSPKQPQLTDYKRVLPTPHWLEPERKGHWDMRHVRGSLWSAPQRHPHNALPPISPQRMSTACVGVTISWAGAFSFLKPYRQPRSQTTSVTNQPLWPF